VCLCYVRAASPSAHLVASNQDHMQLLMNRFFPCSYVLKKMSHEFSDIYGTLPFIEIREYGGEDPLR
jgi:hypothetical protein